VASPSVFDAEIKAAIAALETAHAELKALNMIVFKGYNNNEFLKLGFDSEQQQFIAEANGQVANKYSNGTYASIKHYDQAGNLKATYSVQANQTADAVVAQLNGAAYESGDYLQLAHKEQAQRLAIMGYVEAAPADFTNGVQSLDLTTARFYLDGESFKFSSEALDYTADTTALQALIAEVDALEATNYTPTSYQAVVTAREAAQVIVETFNVTAAQVQAASEQLQQAVSELRLKNEIQIKGYNNEIGLTISFNPETQTLHATTNGKIVHPYFGGTYASIKHYDQQGVLKATYNVLATQTADAVAAQIEGTSYETGDYFQITHKEPTKRLAITGYIEAAPADFSNGVQSLDLTTARFYLDGESFKFSAEALDYTADTTALQALIAEADALEATTYTATSYQAMVTAREAAQA
ncbi:MAG: putative mucin/carbohydrate-binding domain-containing protein, partial [Shewanella sp.]